MTKNISTVILAAGKGERMKSDLPKVMHEIIDKPMIGYVVDVAKKISHTKPIVVVGFGREKVIAYLQNKDVIFSVQEDQKGTAHALLCAENEISGRDVLVLYGDVPLIKEETIEAFLEFCYDEKAVTFMVTKVDDPKGYGRVILQGQTIDKIVEEHEAKAEELQINIINTGICMIPHDFFFFLKRISNDNKKREFYLTDICKVARTEGYEVKAFFYPNSDEVLGVNTKNELFLANQVMRKRILEKHLNAGITILGTGVTIGSDVRIGLDTRIGSNVLITGETVIGQRVRIGSNVIIKECFIEDDAQIGSFVYLENYHVNKGEKIPNFFNIGG
ncbi:MAG: NTP transferase domain-containing protein [Deltaproteobacteria bacterium]|nr:NTP transferase domain-containing protein [Deltaproteobacteria bacterium]